MASHLQRSVDEFQQDFNVRWDTEAQSWRIDAIHGDGCPLLIGNDCSVHPVKPAQCRAFPFWSELLEDREAWADAKSYCPGMDAPAGRLFTAREIRKIRRKADVP